MKTKISKIKLTIALLFAFVLPVSVLAATPDIYICGTGSVTLSYTNPDYTLATGDRVFWQKVDAAGVPIAGSAVVEKVVSATETGALIVTGGTDLTGAGEHFWKSHVISAAPGGCTGDVSSAIDVYLLPPFEVTLTPASSTYCEAGSTNTTKTIVTAAAAVTAGNTLPAGVDFAYDWSGSTTNAGTVDATDQTKFNMTSTTVGTYTITSKAKYVAQGGKLVKGSTGTPCEETGSTTIKVTPKPGTPTISVS
ncbi:hypothetical protein [Pedobacter foliorum]|uniref:hypothetical protein n=1 Tax=Pedobacter foliorum TaxID=2739058 RepID=UPI001563874B|nr:hypothetical protein [Pedobacter foliorum]NRF37946.1 hypothetical protein [Pedobacter foliorum]